MWSHLNTYTCNTFPFTVSCFFAPPRFGSLSTDRELHAICASVSVENGTEISLKCQETTLKEIRKNAQYETICSEDSTSK